MSRDNNGIRVRQVKVVDREELLLAGIGNIACERPYQVRCFSKYSS